jgi:hypothetical protein
MHVLSAALAVARWQMLHIAPLLHCNAMRCSAMFLYPTQVVAAMHTQPCTHAVRTL